MDIIKKRFGEKLKLYRKVQKYTQEQFAEKIDINLRQLARIEAGESFISSETLYKICHTLKISPKHLFDYELEENPAPNRVLNSISTNNIRTNKNLKNLNNKLFKIATDDKKIEYINLAFDSLYNKRALNELKLMIKGIELTQQ